jgi:hypothetical protein
MSAELKKLSEAQARAQEATNEVRRARADIANAKARLKTAAKKQTEAIRDVKDCVREFWEASPKRALPDANQCGMSRLRSGLAQRSRLYGHAAKIRNPEAEEGE